MLTRIRQLLIGPPLPTLQLGVERLNKVRALAAFSPDALSSIAYANQEIYLGLVVAGGAGLALSLPTALVIVAVLFLVALSYFQTIPAYPSGGGSYVVARENLGTLAGLIAASALLIGYLLTAAVSLSAGVEAVASAYPVLWPYRVVLALVLLLIITLLNLRGLRETGTLMSIPVYLFLGAFFAMLGYGLVRALVGNLGAGSAVVPPATVPVSTVLVLRAFAAGCTALTGIEAISNGVPAFQPPESRNAGRTLIVMAVLMALLFAGSVGLTQALGIVSGPDETVVSALARRLLGSSALYIIVQMSTMLILAVAANTSFAGFPRVAALLAQDGFLPRQLANLGDRLVLANGILLLSGATAILIVAFGADTHALIPLFAVGVFLAFTLSQVGMVRHWRRVGGRGWQVKSFFNAAGALATALVVIVVGVAKFVDGAWITLLLIPVLVGFLLKVRGHYRAMAAQLSLEGVAGPQQAAPRPRVVVPIGGVHQGIVDAVGYARAISDDVTALYIEIEPESGASICEKWQRMWPDVKIVVLPSPYRSVVGPLLDFLDCTDQEHDDGQLATIVLPEFVPARWWHGLLHNQTAWLIKAALIYRRRKLGYQRAIIDVPYHLRE